MYRHYPTHSISLDKYEQQVSNSRHYPRDMEPARELRVGFQSLLC